MTCYVKSGHGITSKNEGDGTVSIQRQEAPNTIDVSDSPYVAGGERVRLVDASGGDVTVTLPAVSGNNGLEFVIKRIDNSENTVTVDGDGTEVIEDEETKTLLPGDSMYIITDETQWWII